jgi:drug/metabolite transporter (DMT)-like permease
MIGAVRERRRQVLRSRVSRLRAAHSYRAVLALILATFAFTSIASDATWTTSVLLLLQSLTLATAIWTSGLARPHSPLMVALLAAGTGLAAALFVSDRNGLVGAAGIVSATLVAVTMVVIAVGVVDQNEVNAQSVTGAICIYLLFGIMFLFIYSALAILGSGDFFAQGTDGTRALRLYFSYVTLATLGYGDYTPAGDAGHSLAVLEALLGQVYLVTVVALLVSRVRVRREAD